MKQRTRRAVKRSASDSSRFGGPILLNPQHPKPDANRVDILLGSPTLGTVRIEWYNAMAGMVAPPNWATVRSTPLGYTVPDAQNILVDSVLRGRFRALLLIEDDTVPPPDALIAFDRWFWKMERRKAPPVVSGLYHIKGSAEIRDKGKRGGIQVLGPEPLIYRGSGARAFRDWKPGQVVWCSGVPTGALLLHRSVLEAWAQEPDIEVYNLLGYPFPLRKIFQQPSRVWIEEGGIHVASGTSDLWWSQQTIDRGILAKSGWPSYQKRPYPYVVDTALGFKHIDRVTGVQY